MKRVGSQRARLSAAVLLGVSVAFVATGTFGQSAVDMSEPGPSLDATVTQSLDRPAERELRSQLLEARRLKNVRRLEAIARNIAVSEETLSELDAEIDKLRNDEAELREAMIAAAADQKAASARLSETEARLEDLTGRASIIEVSLAERRDLLAEVLAALQRLGRKPPPALLVKPTDALGAVRSAILLGAVVPSVRRETEKLAEDLAALSRLREATRTEEARFAKELQAYREDGVRLSKLFEEKRRLIAGRRDRRERANARAAKLAGQAGDLEELIASLEHDVAKARAAEEDAARREAERTAAERKAAEERRLAQEAERERLAKEAEERRLAALEASTRDREPRSAATAASPSGQEPEVGTGISRQTRREAGDVTSEDSRQSKESSLMAALRPARHADTEHTASKTPEYDLASLRRAAPRLAPNAAFSTMKGRLPLPVSGRRINGFGDTDDIGREVSGVSYAVRAGDVVVAPADGNVLYAGPFRSYGQLLILDVGDDYHVVLAGMERIDVETGQFVSAGEPVAVMGATRVASVAQAEFGAAEPVLYVEFRRDGKPIDPSPWWMDETPGRTRNDS